MSAVNNVWAWGFPAGSVVKNPPVSAGDPASIPESGRCPGEGMATHSRILAWRISWTEELGRLQSTGSQRVWQDWRNKQQHVGNERCMNTSLFNAVLSKRDPTPFGYLYIFILVFFPPWDLWGCIYCLGVRIIFFSLTVFPLCCLFSITDGML